jgi:hypothetical protein
VFTCAVTDHSYFETVPVSLASRKRRQAWRSCVLSERNCLDDARRADVVVAVGTGSELANFLLAIAISEGSTMPVTAAAMMREHDQQCLSEG